MSGCHGRRPRSGDGGVTTVVVAPSRARRTVARGVWRRASAGAQGAGLARMGRDNKGRDDDADLAGAPREMMMLRPGFTGLVEGWGRTLAGARASDMHRHASGFPGRC